MEHAPHRHNVDATEVNLLQVLRFRPMQRSVYASLVVGTILTAINQGFVIASGDLPSNLAWKIPLTYFVPFCVATSAP